MTVMAIVILIVMNLFVGSGRFVTAEQVRIDVSEKSSRLLAGLDETLREGRAVLASATYNSVTYTTGDDVVVLSTPSLMADGSLSLSETDTVIVHVNTNDPQNKTIDRIISATGVGSTRTTGAISIVQNIKDVYFRYHSDTPTLSTVVTATVTVTGTANNRPFTTAMILNATLRNHP